VSGTVVDAKTNEPISETRVHKENMDPDQAVTDEKGDFSLKSISGGLFGCPAMYVIVSKEGYASQKVKIKNAGHRIVRLKRTLNSK